MLTNRFDFVILFDAKNCNPDGDPDNDNSPRVDTETMHGLVTPFCIKRKIRNYVLNRYADKKGYEIVVQSDRPLNDKYEDAYASIELTNAKKDKDAAAKACKVMEEKYYDVRTFGQIMTTGSYSCGRVTGPVQINMAESIDAVHPVSMTITRQAKTTKERSDASDTEFGQFKYIPYGLYMAVGHVSPGEAVKSGMTDDDVNVLWEAIINMFEDDRSAARGDMAVRKLIVFKHDSPYGNCRFTELEDKVQVKRKPGVSVPRSFKDYDVTIDRNMPEGVELQILL